MRTVSGKGNNARKILAYYSVNFGISAPYRVLCDGPTIFQSLKNDIYLKQALVTLLGATAYPVVTECIVRELRDLGEKYSNAALFAKRVTRVPCAHDGQVSANECVVLRLKTPFEKKLFVATNDVELLGKVSRMPGIPIIAIANQTKLSLRGPSSATLAHVRRSELTKGNSLNSQDKALLEKLRAARGAEELPRKFVKKRKRAKGPNPLSVKKGKKDDASARAPSRVRHQPGQPKVRTSDLSEKEIEGPPPPVAATQDAKEVMPSTADMIENPVAEHVGEVGDSLAGLEAGEKPRRRKRKRRKKNLPLEECAASSGIDRDLIVPAEAPLVGEFKNMENSAESDAPDALDTREEGGEGADFPCPVDPVTKDSVGAETVPNEKHIPILSAVVTADSAPQKDKVITEERKQKATTNENAGDSGNEEMTNASLDESPGATGVISGNPQINPITAEMKTKIATHADEGLRINVPTPKKKQRKNRRRRPKSTSVAAVS